jgi:hypothetical protein
MQDWVAYIWESWQFYPILRFCALLVIAGHRDVVLGFANAGRGGSFDVHADVKNRVRAVLALSHVAGMHGISHIVCDTMLLCISPKRRSVLLSFLCYCYFFPLFFLLFLGPIVASSHDCVFALLQSGRVPNRKLHIMWIHYQPIKRQRYNCMQPLHGNGMHPQKDEKA